MTREELLKSPEYWVTGIQIDLYNCALNFMEQNKMNRTQLAKYLNVSKGYVTQLLNGDYDHRLTKLAELALAFGYVPKMEFIPVQEYITIDSFDKGCTWDTGQYIGTEVMTSCQENSTYITAA